MAHEVFISHALRDKGTVFAICKRLESAQIRCWIAERDISTGEDWTEATRNAIASSRVMVLVLSENANAAPHLEREIAHAFYSKRPILPVRITDTPPKRDFLFYLGNVRWFDAFNSPPEQYLEELAGSIQGILGGPVVSRDVKLPPRIAAEARKTVQYPDSWIGAIQASHYGSLEILKRIAIAASLLTALGLLWLVYSQMNLRESLPQGDVQTINSTRGIAANSALQGTVDSSPSKPNYTYTRLGLWVPSSAGSAPSREEREDRAYVVPSITTPTPLASPTPSLDSNLYKIAVDDQEGSVARDDTSAKSVPPDSPGMADRPTPVAAEPISTQTNGPAAGSTEPENPEDSIQGQADVLLPSPSVAPPEESTPLPAQSGGSLRASPEEESLKELVLAYLRTMATNDSSTQERLLAGRVNFYGKGVLSFSEIGETMERYCRQWPIRKWEPKGEPEFPNILHSSDPDQYEVLQPFDWTVANGSKQKKGSAILYLRIRKAENGAFHIFHLEQRHL
jgi:TIR domain-containing protein